MTFTVRPDEKRIREGRANLQRGLEFVGGRLWLTDQRLFFESHPFNFQRAPAQIELSDVTGIQLRWTKLFGFMPVLPNLLAVQTAGGEEFCFVLYGRDQWAADIRAQTQTAGA